MATLGQQVWRLRLFLSAFGLETPLCELLPVSGNIEWALNNAGSARVVAPTPRQWPRGFIGPTTTELRVYDGQALIFCGPVLSARNDGERVSVKAADLTWWFHRLPPVEVPCHNRYELDIVEDLLATVPRQIGSSFRITAESRRSTWVCDIERYRDLSSQLTEVGRASVDIVNIGRVFVFGSERRAPDVVLGEQGFTGPVQRVHEGSNQATRIVVRGADDLEVTVQADYDGVHVTRTFTDSSLPTEDACRRYAEELLGHLIAPVMIDASKSPIRHNQELSLGNLIPGLVANIESGGEIDNYRIEKLDLKLATREVTITTLPVFRQTATVARAFEAIQPGVVPPRLSPYPRPVQRVDVIDSAATAQPKIWLPETLSAGDTSWTALDGDSRALEAKIPPTLSDGGGAGTVKGPFAYGLFYHVDELDRTGAVLLEYSISQYWEQQGGDTTFFQGIGDWNYVAQVVAPGYWNNTNNPPKFALIDYNSTDPSTDGIQIDPTSVGLSGYARGWVRISHNTNTGAQEAWLSSDGVTWVSQGTRVGLAEGFGGGIDVLVNSLPLGDNFPEFDNMPVLHSMSITADAVPQWGFTQEEAAAFRYPSPASPAVASAAIGDVTLGSDGIWQEQTFFFADGALPFMLARPPGDGVADQMASMFPAGADLVDPAIVASRLGDPHRLYVYEGIQPHDFAGIDFYNRETPFTQGTVASGVTSTVIWGVADRSTVTTGIDASGWPTGYFPFGDLYSGGAGPGALSDEYSQWYACADVGGLHGEFCVPWIIRRQAFLVDVPASGYLWISVQAGNSDATNVRVAIFDPSRTATPVPVDLADYSVDTWWEDALIHTGKIPEIEPGGRYVVDGEYGLAGTFDSSFTLTPLYGASITNDLRVFEGDQRIVLIEYDGINYPTGPIVDIDIVGLSSLLPDGSGSGPAIVTSSPSNVTVNEGQEFSLFATATNYTHYWIYEELENLSTRRVKYGVDAPANYRQVGVADNGADRVSRWKIGFVGWDATEVFSNWATVTVTAAPVLLPVFTTQPNSVTGDQGDLYEITARANNVSTYRVYARNAQSPDQVNGVLVQGDRTSPLTFSSSFGSSNQDVRFVLMHEGVESVFSNWATVTVADLPLYPVVTTQPSPTSVETGQPFTFTATGSNITSTKAYYRLNGSAFFLEDGTGPSASYTAAAAIGDDGKEYGFMLISSDGSFIYTDFAALTVTAPTGPTPVITLQPLPVAVTEGDPWEMVIEGFNANVVKVYRRLTAATGEGVPYVDNQKAGLSPAAAGFPRNESFVVESALGASPTAAQINAALTAAKTAAAAGDPHVVTAHGVISIDVPIELQSRSVLRVTPGQTGRIETSAAMNSMVNMNGGFVQPRTCTLTGLFNETTAEVTDLDTQLALGIWQLGTNSSNGPGGQQVEITAINGSTVTLAEALAQDFTDINMGSMNNDSDWCRYAGLEGFTLAPLHDVIDLVSSRAGHDCWIVDYLTEGTQQTSGVEEVPIAGAVGQQSAAIYLRQAYHFLIDNIELDNAAEHGDGGMGYGVNIGNHDSMVLVRSATVRHMRHSILVHGGSSASTVDSPHTSLPLHPNFPNGGATEISIHGYCSGITFINVDTGRIMIVDAAQPGPNNTFAKCTLRNGPFTLDGTNTNQLSDVLIIELDVLGNIGALRNLKMPALNTVSTGHHLNDVQQTGEPSTPRPYWFGSYNAVTNEYDPGASSPNPFTQGTDGVHTLGDGIYLPNPAQVDTASIVVSGSPMSTYPSLAWWTNPNGPDESDLVGSAAFTGRYVLADAQADLADDQVEWRFGLVSIESQETLSDWAKLTVAPLSPNSPPDAPTGQSVTPRDSEAFLSWLAPANVGGAAISDYVIEYQTSPAGGWSTFADGVSIDTTATVTGLTNGTAYDFRVSAVNSVGTGVPSATTTTTPVAAVVPGAPTGVTAIPGDSEVFVSWTAPVDDGGSVLTDYLVEFQTSPAGGWATFADGVSTGTSATVTGLTNGTAYDFRVSAINSAGAGTSAVATATPAVVGEADVLVTDSNATAVGPPPPPPSIPAGADLLITDSNATAVGLDSTPPLDGDADLLVTDVGAEAEGAVAAPEGLSNESGEAFLLESGERLDLE